MTIKCKICGGDIQFNVGDTCGQCDHCGCTSTVPKADDEQKLNRYNRANHFRRQCEFDKAIAAYERILEEDETDAEAHWGAALSRYGIEYVEDPVTKKRIPTCHRVQVESILADADYQDALKYAPDKESKRIYEEQAKEIAEIQKGILAISANEEPYDIFICYKETDENGKRTRDSALAQEVYYGLTGEGYKVFFSRITLEDKLGQQYEPYIFAALNSAKVMIVIGTKPEYFNAVWVKNEWSRYLHLMKDDRKRLLIPCYRDMDPYELPEELGNLQSQDMNRIGFLQDLLRGIRKVTGAESREEKETHTENPEVRKLLDRAFLLIEGGKFDKADEIAEKVLNLDPRNSQAFFAKLMISRKAKNTQELAEGDDPLNRSMAYQRALIYADPAMKRQLEAWDRTIQEKKKEKANSALYEKAMGKLDAGLYIEALDLFKKLGDYRDSGDMAKEAYYQLALIDMKAEDFVSAAGKLENLGNYRDSQSRLYLCRDREEERRIQEKENRQKAVEKGRRDDRILKTKRWLKLLAPALVILVAVICIKPAVLFVRYNMAVKEQKNGNYAKAVEIYRTLDRFGDSETKIDECIRETHSQSIAPFTKKGATVQFGRYDWRNAVNEKKEKIDWYVLDVKDGEALLLSVYGLDAKPYHDRDVDVTWSSCYLRSWLNSTFYRTAFNETEQAVIQATKVKNPSQRYSEWKTSAGSDTTDRVFLLSYNEAYKYLGVTIDSRENKKARVAPSPYAIGQGAQKSGLGTSEEYASGWWWLRSPGKNQRSAAYVLDNGTLEDSPVTDKGCVVRPAIWLNLESDYFYPIKR